MAAAAPPRRGGRRGLDRNRPRKYTRIPVENIDYKDLTLIRRFISDRGKIRSRRVTGLSAATSSSSRWPSSGLVRWRCCLTSATARPERGMAQAILLKDVEGLGGVGDAIEVSPGYLRNFLVPASSPSRRRRAPSRRPSAAARPPRRPPARRSSVPARRPRCSPRPC